MEGSGGVVKDAGRLVAAPFLVKTYRLVDDPLTDHIVSWGDRDSTFVVWRPKEFSASLLPTYFNHTNFSSFVRQLNTYGFRKIVRGRCEFGNELFRKGQKHLLSRIQRRKPSTTSTTQIEFDKYSSLPTISSIQHSDHVSAAAPSLSEENETLRRRNSFLLSEIDCLKSICSKDVRLFIRHNTRDPPPVTDVAKEVRMSPPKLFGVPLY